MTTNESQNLMTRSLLDVFNQRDPQQRAAAIGEVYGPDIVFYEEDGSVAGAAALRSGCNNCLTTHRASSSRGRSTRRQPRPGTAAMDIRAS